MRREENSSLKKAIQESPKLQELRAKRISTRRRLSILFGVFFLTLLGAFIFFVHLPKYHLSNIVVIGNQIIGTDEIVDEVNSIISGNKLYVIPYKNAFFYPKARIIESLTQKYPKLNTIDVYRIGYKKIVVSVTERRGYALWCGQNALVNEEGEVCYFTDNTGKIISLAPYFSGNVYPRFFGTALSISESEPLGKHFIDESQFQNLLAFQKRFNDFGFQVKSINLVSETEYQLVLDLGNQKTANVRFLNNADYKLLANNLAVAMSKKEFADKLSKNRANLEYFDLRFTNKVYYKFSEHP